MKKVSRKKVMELLKKKENYTYQELASLTGYHSKSLIRIHSKLKKDNYFIKEKKKISLKKEMVDHYLASKYQTYQEYYDKETLYPISYSSFCKICEDIKVNKDIVFIRKIKIKEKIYFEVIDLKREKILFCLDSLKNDKKSVKRILYILLTHFGSPKNISFTNFFKTIPLEIQNLLTKYKIEVVPFKSIYRNHFKTLKKNQEGVTYRKVTINKEDFYDFKVRKTIKDNMVQFENARYFIKSNKTIKEKESVLLFYDEQKTDLFIQYQGLNYDLKKYQNIQSKKGNSKYNSF